MRPRPVLPGKTYLFTRRCSERRFFLRPDAETNNVFWYCLGWAAEKHGLVLHGAVAMSNHVHVVATDPRGVYPNFLRDFHGLLARAMNALRGRWEHFWDANQASAVLLEDADAQLEKLGYVLGNPADLVEKAAHWPGATALHAVLGGGPIVAALPRHFFREEQDGGALPATVTLRFEPPPAAASIPAKEFVDRVSKLVAAKEATAAQNRRDRGILAMRPSHVKAQHWNDRPSNFEARRGLSPAVACRDKWLRIERLKKNATFQGCYRAAFEAFRTGLATIFPLGTWLMKSRAAITLSDV